MNKANVALLAEQAEVEFDAAIMTNVAVLVEAVEDAGFDGALISVTGQPRVMTQVRVMDGC